MSADRDPRGGLACGPFGLSRGAANERFAGGGRACVQDERLPLLTKNVNLNSHLFRRYDARRRSSAL